MTKPYLAVVELPSVSGKPEDTFENTFAFTAADDHLTASAAITAALADFYTFDSVSTGRSLSSFLSPAISRASNAASVTTYEIGAAVAGGGDFNDVGSPLYVGTFTLDASVSLNPLPSELAVCLSFHGALDGLAEESGLTRPAARHRGRVFIGPLSNDAGALDKDATTKRPLVGSSFRNVLAEMAGRLLSDVNTVWSVWSRSNAALYPVVGGFIDDAFDVQRRRGEKTLARTLWP